MNFEKVVNMMIKNKVHDLIIDELFEQTDAAMKNKEHQDASLYVYCKTINKKIFGKRARINLLVQMVN